MPRTNQNRGEGGRYHQEVSGDDVEVALKTAVEQTGDPTVMTSEVHDHLDVDCSRRSVRRRLNDLADAGRVWRLEFDADVPFLLWEPAD